MLISAPQEDVQPDPQLHTYCNPCDYHNNYYAWQTAPTLIT